MLTVTFSRSQISGGKRTGSSGSQHVGGTCHSPEQQAQNFGSKLFLIDLPQLAGSACCFLEWQGRILFFEISAGWWHLVPGTTRKCSLAEQLLPQTGNFFSYQPASDSNSRERSLEPGQHCQLTEITRKFISTEGLPLNLSAAFSACLSPTDPSPALYL